MLRFLVRVLRFRVQVLCFRVPVFRFRLFGCFVLRYSFSSASFSTLPTTVTHRFVTVVLQILIVFLEQPGPERFLKTIIDVRSWGVGWMGRIPGGGLPDSQSSTGVENFKTTKTNIRISSLQV